MNCKQMGEDVFLDFATGKLSGAARVTAEKHLASCEGCRTRLAGFQAVSNVLDEWETPELSPWFNARLRQRIAARAAEEEASRWSWLHAFDWLKRPATATAFAAVLAMGSAAMWMARPSTESTPTAPPAKQAKQAPAQADELLPVVEDFDMLANFDAITDLKPKVKKSEI
jgi:hypothetical protein